MRQASGKKFKITHFQGHWVKFPGSRHGPQAKLVDFFFFTCTRYLPQTLAYLIMSQMQVNIYIYIYHITKVNMQDTQSASVLHSFSWNKHWVWIYFYRKFIVVPKFLHTNKAEKCIFSCQERKRGMNLPLFVSTKPDILNQISKLFSIGSNLMNPQVLQHLLFNIRLSAHICICINFNICGLHLNWIKLSLDLINWGKIRFLGMWVTSRLGDDSVAIATVN